MPTFIRCPECGNNIGAYQQFIDAAKAAIYAEKVFNSKTNHSNYDPEKMIFDPSITPSLEPLFNAIGLKLRCCRMHSVTKVDFDKMYK
jgi:DNA-directed RNA polymerase subunit N (RpoN/RPB10)